MLQEVRMHTLRKYTLLVALLSAATAGVVASPPVLANCGTHQSGGGCGKAGAPPAEPEPTEPGELPDVSEVLAAIFDFFGL